MSVGIVFSELSSRLAAFVMSLAIHRLRKRFREEQKSVPLDRTILGVGPGGAKV